MIIDQNENLTIITQENASVIELVKKIETLYHYRVSKYLNFVRL